MAPAPDITRTRNNAPVIRRLWWNERGKWRDHLLRLAPGDRRDRFSGLVSDAFIEQYCSAANPFSVILYGAFVDGELRAVGELVMLKRESPRRAELAFSVEEGWQNRGLGTELFRRLVIYARNRSVSRVYLMSEPGNGRMQHIARNFGMVLDSEDGELTGRLELLAPSYFTVVEQLVEEGMALFRSAPAVTGH